MSVKLMFTVLATLIFGIVSLDASAHVTKSDCDTYMQKMPSKSKLDRVGIHHCIIEWDTINGYAPTLFVQEYGCTYNGSWKYNIRNLSGRDFNDNNREYRFSREGFKYKRYYACPVQGTGHNKRKKVNHHD